MGTELTEVSPMQRRVIEAVRRRSEATVDELAEALGISASAVRQHLAPLRSAGLVAARQQRGHAGRPADVYHCTSLSDPLFPVEQNLAVEILDDLHDEDPELVGRFFERRRRRMVDAVRADHDDTPVADRVAAITEQLDAQGYLAEFDETDDGGFRIHLHNCPIWNVANRYDHACTAELGLLEDVLPDTEVTRLAHKHEHCSECSYHIAPVTGQDRAGSPGSGR